MCSNSARDTGFSGNDTSNKINIDSALINFRNIDSIDGARLDRQAPEFSKDAHVPTNKIPKTAYEAQLEQLFGGACRGISSQFHDDSLEYSDVSACKSEDGEYETGSDEDDVPNDTSTKDTDNVDNANVLEILQEYINSDENVGLEISASLAKLVNSGLRATTSHDKVLELSKKYDKPGNVESLKVPRVNLGEEIINFSYFISAHVKNE